MSRSRTVTWVFFLVAFAASCAALSQQGSPAVDPGENRIALIIGNSNYSDAPLANPVNDARAMAKALADAGFQVKIHTNLTQSQMRRAIREFGDELHAKQGVGLFYFAGHGVQISNRNFLIPVGADIQREYEVEDRAVDAGSVLAMMGSAKARVNIVILDACRNNPFMRNFRSAINGLAPMQAPAGTLVAFSTAPGQTAVDGTGQYGLYTEHLLQNLAIPGLKIEDVFKNVRVGVQRASSGKQVPWENTSLTGDFFFRSAVGTASAPSPTALQQAVEAALRKREEEEASRRATQQGEIEQAVLAALRKREMEQEAAQKSKAEKENRAAQAAIEALKKELAELRAANPAESPRTTQQSIPTKSAEEPKPRTAAQPTAPETPAPEPPPPPPAQVALGASAVPRPQPAVKAGGRVERPDLRVGDKWTYVVTDGFTNLKESVAIEVVTLTANRIYTRGRRVQQAALGATGTGSVVDVWDRDWNKLREGENDFAPYYPTFQFPLAVGNTWSGRVTFVGPTNIGVRHDVSARVVGWERVTVPAGSFDAVRISLKGHFSTDATRGASNPHGSVDNVVWYAPSVRQVVRQDINQKDMSRAHTLSTWERWELVEYKTD